MKLRYMIGFLLLFLTAGLLLTASYQYTYRRSLDRQMAQDNAQDSRVGSGEETGTESIAAEGEAVENESGTEDGYWLSELHGFVTVYLSDRKTIYELTEIPLTDLPEEVQQEVAAGKAVKDKKELYAFLQNYSS